LNRPTGKYDVLSLCYIGLSLFGLGILAFLTFTFKASVRNFPLQRELTGSIFAAICLQGIVVGVTPSSCSRILHLRGRGNDPEKTGQKDLRATLKFRGHHPTCGNFSAHVLQVRGKTYCAGCSGLVTGAIISLTGNFLYFFAGLNFGGAGFFVFGVGSVGVVFGLLQHHIFKGRGASRFFSNVIFASGAFLILVGVNELTGSLLLECYLFTLIIYWIITRIMLSKLEHNKICAACGLKLCNFPQKGKF